MIKTLLTAALLATTALAANAAPTTTYAISRTAGPVYNGFYGPYPEETYTTYGNPQSRTAVLIPHGGWLSSGNNAVPSVVQLANYLAKQGMFVIAPNYRLDQTHPGQGHPAQVQDIQLLIREAHKAGFGNVGVIGLSAGGFIALNLDFSNGAIRWFPTDPMREVMLDPNQSSMPDWAVSVSGFWDLNAGNLNERAEYEITQNIAPLDADLSQATIYAIASPITHMRNGAPPLLVIHGTNDKVIPLAQAQDANVLCSSIMCNAHFEYTTGGHVFSGLSPSDKARVFSDIAAFATTGGKFQ